MTVHGEYLAESSSLARLKRLFVVLFVLGFVVWLGFAFFVGPGLVERAYHGEGVDYIARMMKRRDTNSLEHYLGYWYRFTALGTVLLLGLGAYGYALLSPKFFQRCVGSASAQQLGMIRMIVFGCLLASALWEHLPSLNVLPHSLYHGVGVIGLLGRLPGFETFVHSETGLRVFQWLAIGILFSATIGLATRWTVLVGTVAYCMLGGLLRSYSWPYHTGILPLYVGAVMSFTPCGAAWSVDAILRRRRGLPTVDPETKSAAFGWACYACWATIALALAAAGMSKVRNGGWSWLDANSFRSILFSTTLTPMQFDFRLSLLLRGAPDWVFQAMAMTGMGLQLSCISMLFSRRARMVLPVLLAGMHLSIWLLQNILFFEVIVMQLVFYDFGRWQSALRQRFSGRFATPPHETTGSVHSINTSYRMLGQMALTWLVACVLLMNWLAKFEYYPLTAMQMFSRPSIDRGVTYYRAIAHYASGASGRAPLERCVPALRDSRYRGMLKAAFAENNDLAREFYMRCTQAYNSGRPAADKIMAIEIQQWYWEYDEPPVHGEFGHLVARRRFDQNGDQTR